MRKLDKQAELVCKKCGETKARAEFKRRLSAEEYARMLGQVSVRAGTTVISSLCKPCQPKRKPRSKLTLKELRTKVTKGTINKWLGESLITEKRDAINKVRSRVMREYWQKVKNKDREELQQKLNREVTQAKNKYYAYKHRTETCPIKPNRQNGIDINKAGWENEIAQLEQARKDHLAVLQTQYRKSIERRLDELMKYDKEHKK